MSLESSRNIVPRPADESQGLTADEIPDLDLLHGDLSDAPHGYVADVDASFEAEAAEDNPKLSQTTSQAHQEMQMRYELYGDEITEVLDRVIRFSCAGLDKDIKDEVKSEAWLGWLKRGYRQDVPPEKQREYEIRLMHAIAINKRADYFRNAYAHRQIGHIGQDDKGMLEALPSQDPSVESQALDRASEGTLLAFLSKVTVDSLRHRTLIDLILANPEITTNELASALGITESTARVARYRALAYFRESLNKVCGAKETDDPGIEQLKRLLHVTRRVPSRQQSAKKQAEPRTTPAKKRQEVAASLARSRDEANTSVAVLSVPHYIGMWGVAALDIAHFVGTSTEKTTAAIVYPRPELLERFREYIAHLVGGNISSFYIDTPQNIAQLAQARTLDYLAGPDTVLQREHRFAESGFRLHLLNRKTSHESGGRVTHDSPLYSDIGARKISWSGNESQRYLQEYFFTTGTPMLGKQAIKLSKAGQGPSVQRLIEAFKDWKDLENAAGTPRS